MLRVIDHIPDAAPIELTVSGESVARAFADRADEIRSLLRAEGFAVAYYRDRRRLPYRVARQLSGLVPGLGDGDVIGWRGGRNTLPARLDVDHDLAWLLGMYVAGGNRRTGQVVVTNTDQALLDRCASTLTRVGLTFHRGPGAITVRSSLFSALLGWLVTGERAPTKRVPPIVFGWPTDLVASFVEGLVDGDGSLDGERTSMWTTSSGLRDDVLFLFGRLGRPAGSRARPWRANALPSWEVYAADNEHELQTVHGLSVGHFPQSFDIATVGGWVACRGAGQYSTRYGKIEDIAVGLEVVTAASEVVRTGGAPAARTIEKSLVFSDFRR